jgi:hypothetical protein
MFDVELVSIEDIVDISFWTVVKVIWVLLCSFRSKPSKIDLISSLNLSHFELTDA